MKHLYLILCLTVVFANLFGQSPEPEETFNIVPNPSFESYAAPPIGWFYTGRHFTNVVKYWSAATAASPDIFGPRVRVPLHWQEKDFGKQSPQSGNSMVGITVYGCEEGKPHCREYLQIQLHEPLVVGQNYYAEFWTSHLPKSLQINNLGMYFSSSRIERHTDEVLHFSPQVNTEEIIIACDMKWVKISGHFVAEAEADYLIIGNFFPDGETQMDSTCAEHLKFAYYYIDDVLVKKEEPILPVPVKEDDLSKVELTEGKVITLRNIFFETDKAALLPRSYTELNKLLKLMEDNPNMIIQINGHTDIRGDHEYNIDLSRRRAQAVVEFLTANGIKRERSTFQGFGSTQPIATNKTDEGRQLNRRVEFVIIRK